MKTNIIKLMWGIVLIALGGLFLADTLGYLDLEVLAHHDWTIVFAAGSAVFFLSYFLAGVRKWGWLFPALIFAALALVIGEDELAAGTYTMKDLKSGEQESVRADSILDFLKKKLIRV